MKRFNFGLVLALAIISFTSLAAAQSAMPCTSLANLRTELEKNHKETPVSLGLGEKGAVYEIYASPEGTFTIVLNIPNGMSCMIGSGSQWMNIKPKVTAPTGKGF